jgi:two-component system response regulator RegA
MIEETLLIVDDDEVFASVLARAMARRFARVEVANTVEEALACAMRCKPEKIVLDLKIHEASGLDIIKSLCDTAVGVEIVVLTGYSSIATTVEAMRLGATNYLCKPVDADELCRAFERSSSDPTPDIPTSPPSVGRLQWEHIQKVLSQNDGNISATARALGMHRRTLQRRLQKRPVGR